MATISFWGGVGTVTGSKYLVENGGGRVLVDCGLFQGLRELRERNWDEPPFDAKSLDAVVITHAHVDHTGYLPRVVALGFDGPVYCSRGTADLLKLLLPDSARLQEEEADYRNRHNLTRYERALPLYTEEDARGAEVDSRLPEHGRADGGRRRRARELPRRRSHTRLKSRAA